MTVEANTSGRSLGEVTTDINARIDKLTLPPGVRITQGGDAESQAEVFGRIFSALGLAVLLMYLILVVQFGSFLDPLAIMMSLPLSLIGVMLALVITGIDDQHHEPDRRDSVDGHRGEERDSAHRLREVGARAGRACASRDALIEAGAIRLRPILMTTLRADRRHDPGRARHRRGRAVPRSARRAR